MKSNKEILLALFNEEDLQMSITLNPQLNFFIQAMDEARRESAVGFLEWIKDNSYTKSGRDGYDRWYELPYREVNPYYTTSELYSLYVKSINK